MSEKNVSTYNETRMASTDAMIVAKSESGPTLKVELKDVPVQFVNAIRRILLNETPVVEVQDVVIHTNTTAMPHEMLRHRIEMLPVAVRPTETDLLMKTKIELRVGLESDDVKNLTTDDFVVSGDRKDVLMKDRDIGEPLFVLRMRKGESIHITARLGVNPNGSQVCTTSYGYHIDPEAVKAAKEQFLADNATLADAERVFDTSYTQRYYMKNEQGRPNWFDLFVETLGVIPSRELVQMAAKTLRDKAKRWGDSVKDKIVRSAEEGVYTFISAEGHTLGALLQFILYSAPEMVSLVDYDIPHPLRQEMRLRVLTDKRPEEVIDFAVAKVKQYCETLEKEI
jgi:DNA-directed RNA polymerase subunit L